MASQLRLSVVLLSLAYGSLCCYAAENASGLPGAHQKVEAAVDEDELSQVLLQLKEISSLETPADQQGQPTPKSGLELHNSARKLCELSIKLLSRPEKQKASKSKHLAELLMHTSRLCTYLAERKPPKVPPHKMGPVDRFLLGVGTFCDTVDVVDRANIENKKTYDLSLNVCQLRRHPSTATVMTTSAATTTHRASATPTTSTTAPATTPSVAATTTISSTLPVTSRSVAMPTTAEHTEAVTAPAATPEHHTVLTSHLSGATTNPHTAAVTNSPPSTTGDATTTTAHRTQSHGKMVLKSASGFCKTMSKLLASRGKREVKITSYGMLLMRAAGLCSYVPNPLTMHAAEDPHLQRAVVIASGRFCNFVLRLLSEHRNNHGGEEFVGLTFSAARLCASRASDVGEY